MLVYYPLSLCCESELFNGAQNPTLTWESRQALENHCSLSLTSNIPKFRYT